MPARHRTRITPRLRSSPSTARDSFAGARLLYAVNRRSRFCPSRRAPRRARATFGAVSLMLDRAADRLRRPVRCPVDRRPLARLAGEGQTPFFGSITLSEGASTVGGQALPLHEETIGFDSSEGCRNYAKIASRPRNSDEHIRIVRNILRWLNRNRRSKVDRKSQWRTGKHYVSRDNVPLYH